MVKMAGMQPAIFITTYLQNLHRQRPVKNKNYLCRVIFCKIMLTSKTPDIRIISDKKLIGKKKQKCLAQNKTFELWKSFMPRRKEIKHPVSSDLFSIQVYASHDKDKVFSFETIFDKWAAMEVSTVENIPSEMESFLMPGGLYAVFHYRGVASKAAASFQYIFTDWLPSSGYELDARPHFEILGEKHKHEDPASEEEIWIPIKK